MIKVLVVGSSENCARVQEALEGVVQVLKAYTPDQAIEYLRVNSDITLVSVESFVGGRVSEAIKLTRKIQETFRGPVIGVSRYPAYQDFFVRAGCTYKTAPEELPHLILRILKQGT